ncbi:hypothetical protein CEXT_97691 [Caerostris extrusa]|uniref:Uncharacterized protein n=1 Tax=Caerostris extrusa TaxID=172846 RepID=A0AAV4XSE3_CAEEX|nr:hypothetical protein CEXT_97691 [Caerostris extrusa]
MFIPRSSSTFDRRKALSQDVQKLFRAIRIEVLGHLRPLISSPPTRIYNLTGIPDPITIIRAPDDNKNTWMILKHEAQTPNARELAN